MKTKLNSTSDYQSEGILEFTFSSITMMNTLRHFHSTEEKTTACTSLQGTLYCHTFVLVLAEIGLIFS